MLSTHDNGILTAVGPGTPMGELFRRFWLPALLPAELPGPDCPPVRIRLLGENLVAFHTTSGEVGFIAESCPHRGASMFFGRNEEDGLRCVYHGWKFDTTGACVDMPNEPAESNFKHKIRATAYPAREHGGLIWVYMGPPAVQPGLPPIEWARVPASHRFVAKVHLSANYMQGLEGEMDSAHVAFLHRWFNVDQMPNRRGFDATRLFAAPAPAILVRPTAYGMAYGARRPADGGYHWRVTQLLLPTHSMIPGPNWPHFGHHWTPADDENTWNFYYAYHPDRPLTEEERAYYGSGVTAVPQKVPGTFTPLASRANDYLLDREMQRTRNFTGIHSSGVQDMAMAESMGPIYDRTREHLGTTDAAVIMARRTLIRMALDLQQGIEPEAAAHPELYRIRPVEGVSPTGDLDAFMTERSEELRSVH